MKKLLIAASLVLAFTANAQEVKAGFPYCLDADSIMQVYKATKERDKRMLDHLQSSGQCGVFGENYPVSVLRETIGLKYARVWVGDSHADLWVYASAILESN